MVLPKFRWPMWRNQHNQLINVPAFSQPGPLNTVQAAPPPAQVPIPNDGNPLATPTIDTASQTDHYNNKERETSAGSTSSEAEGLQRQPDTSSISITACMTCDQIKTFLHEVVATADADQASSGTFAKLISSIQLDDVLFKDLCERLRVEPVWINLSNHEVERAFKMIWAVSSSITVQPAQSRGLASRAGSIEEMIGETLPNAGDHNHTSSSIQTEQEPEPTPQTALEQYYLDHDGKTRLETAVIQMRKDIGFPRVSSIMPGVFSWNDDTTIWRVLSKCSCTSTECRAVWLIVASAIKGFELAGENLNAGEKEKDHQISLLESSLSNKDLQIQDLLTTKAEYEAKAEAAVSSVKPNTESQNPLEQYRGFFDPLSRRRLLNAKRDMEARIRDIIQKIPPKAWIQSPESQLQTEHSMHDGCLAMCGCEKLDCRAIHLVLADFVSLQVQADMLYNQEVLNNVERHQAADDMATQLHNEVERSQKAISALRTEASKNKKMATESQELADKTSQTLRDLEEELSNPETANAKKWEINKWRAEAVNAALLRAANEKLKEENREVQSLRDTNDNLQELANQTPVLQTEIADLQAKITSIKANNKVETERLRKDIKTLRNSEEGQLSQELHEANSKNKALSDKIRQLEDQLAIASSTPTTPTLPEPPKSTGTLSSINFNAFPIKYNASRTYETESSRLLKYFRKQSIDLAARAKGITDQGGAGWSAYEQLEKVVITLAPHNAAAVANVFELRPDLERNERLNTMGFVPWDAAKNGKKR